jgi:hypothetical protein
VGRSPTIDDVTSVRLTKPCVSPKLVDDKRDGQMRALELLKELH